MMFGRMQAQAYLETLRKNTRRAMAVKKVRNELVGSVPYGFRLMSDGVHLEKDPYEYPILLRIIELRRAGLGARRIAATLTEEGYRPRGKAWNPGNLHVMMQRWVNSDLVSKLLADLEHRGTRRLSGGLQVTSLTIKASLPESPRRKHSILTTTIEVPISSNDLP